MHYAKKTNCSSRAECGSSNLWVRLFQLSKKLYICFYFLFLVQSVEILQNDTVVATVSHSITFASCSKKSYDVTEV